jgi:acetyltransferase-like isoleucine patch superfamily enzyme
MGVSFRAVKYVWLGTQLLRLTPLSAVRWVETERGLEIRGRVWIPETGRVRIGRGVRLVGIKAPIELRAHPGAELVIGDGVVIEDGASIEATGSVRIGAGTRIGAFCKIMDNHFHRTVGDRHDRPEPVPVVIGEGAMVGPRCVILPGAEVGPGARLGPASVLSFRLPAGMVLAGREPNNPGTARGVPVEHEAPSAARSKGADSDAERGAA